MVSIYYIYACMLCIMYICKPVVLVVTVICYKFNYKKYMHICILFIDAELLEMIERADTDTDGEISPDEFYAIMTKKTFT